MIGNFFKEPQTIEVSVHDEFNFSPEDTVEFENLLDPSEEVVVESGELSYSLEPGEFAVLRLKSASLAPVLSSSPITAPWDWDGNKNKTVMVHQGQALLIENPQPFEVHFIANATGRRDMAAATREADTGPYQVSLGDLEPGDYSITFRWPGKQTNDGWEGEDGIKFYHFTVLPEGPANSQGRLSIRLTRDDFNAYPHHTVTLSNGIGSILRMPVRPLNRDQHEGGIRIGGHVSKYDGFLVNLMKRGTPDEAKRVVYRGTVDDVTLHFSDGRTGRYHLDASTFDHFERYPLPSWTYVIQEGGEKVVVEKTVVLKQNENAFALNYRIISATLGVENTELFVRPDIDQRTHHETTTITPESMGWWAGKHAMYLNPDNQPVGFVLHPVNEAWRDWYPGFNGIQMYATQGRYQEAHERHYSDNPLETERGQGEYTDSYSPGFFSSSLMPGDSASIVFSSMDINTPSRQYSEEDVQSTMQENIALMEERLDLIKDRAARADPFVQKLVLALWEFIVERDEFFTVIAGHPWFSDWGRDTFIAFDGILAAGMDEVARGLIMAFGKFEGKDGNKGMLPNIINGSNAGNWDTVDAPLLYILAVRNYIESTKDTSILSARTGGRTIREIIESIIEGYQNGTPNGIRMDSETGLIYSPAHYTWMDTNYPAATPREGYTVENNARWFETLMWVSDIYKKEENFTKAKDYSQLAGQVQENFNKLFWNEAGGYLADTIKAGPGVSALYGEQDNALRPNQLIAVLSRYGLLSKDRQRKVAKIVEAKLLVPTGLRTLSEDTQSSSEYPYQGIYEGSDDHGRKQAYHNGTVWPHLFGDWALAYVTAYDFSQESIHYVLPYFSPIEQHLKEAGVGSVSEVRDGNYPHRPRGTDAQAWSVALPLAAYMEIKYGQDSAALSSPLNILAGGQADNVSSPLSRLTDIETQGESFGGIDLNAELMNLKIKRDNNGVLLSPPQQPMQNLQIEGLFPVIIHVAPVDLPLIIGLKD